MKNVITFAICALFTLTIASAVEVGTTQAESESLESLNLADTFLGCVESRHECREEAQSHGYHHSYTERDHHTCPSHHSPLACYAE